MKNFLLTALLGLLVLNPFSKVVTVTPRECKEAIDAIHFNPAALSFIPTREYYEKLFAECEKLSKGLVPKLELALNNRARIMQGSYPAHMVLKSHEEVIKIADGMRMLNTPVDGNPTGGFGDSLGSRDFVGFGILRLKNGKRLVESTPEALLTVEKCHEIFSNKFNGMLMVWALLISQMMKQFVTAWLLFSEGK